MKSNILFLFALFVFCSFKESDILKKATKYFENNNQQLTNTIIVSIKNQELYYIIDGKIIKKYLISSSEYGIGSKEGSNKTPLGLHRIKKKAGGNVPENGRMIGRVFTGEICKIYHDETRSKTDDITSRILWLEGLEAGKNKGKGIDSFERYIYIHGTTEEGRIGIPSSHGCIRMRNKDVIDLYKEVKVGTLVLIF